jgi:hypothetical protein
MLFLWAYLLLLSPPCMDDFHQLTLAEAIAISQNPYAIVIRSKKECGISGSGHVAALTNTFSLVVVT